MLLPLTSQPETAPPPPSARYTEFHPLGSWCMWQTMLQRGGGERDEERESTKKRRGEKRGQEAREGERYRVQEQEKRERAKRKMREGETERNALKRGGRERETTSVRGFNRWSVPWTACAFQPQRRLSPAKLRGVLPPAYCVCVCVCVCVMYTNNIYMYMNM